MTVKYDEYIIKCTYREFTVFQTALRTLECDYKTHRFSNKENKNDVTKLIKKLHDVHIEHAEQYNKKTINK